MIWWLLLAAWWLLSLYIAYHVGFLMGRRPHEMSDRDYRSFQRFMKRRTP